LRPSAEETVHRKQDVLQVKQGGKHRHFLPGDKVYVKNFRPGGSLMPPIVGGLSLQLPVRLCRSTCRASGADNVREGVPRMSTADTANIFKMGPEGGGTRAPNFKGFATEAFETSPRRHPKRSPQAPASGCRQDGGRQDPTSFHVAGNL
ncbi:hypothetical protein HPB47_017678, partial [Ixodes persulcatus]